MICAKVLKKLRTLHPWFPISVSRPFFDVIHTDTLVFGWIKPTLISNPKVERSKSSEGDFHVESRVGRHLSGSVG